jgi:hypothetical protein
MTLLELATECQIQKDRAWRICRRLGIKLEKHGRYHVYQLTPAEENRFRIAVEILNHA